MKQDQKFYTISKVAKILDVTTQAVYKRIDKMDDTFKEYIIQKNNITHINEDGLNILKSMNEVKDKKNEPEKDLNDFSNQVANLVDNLVTNQVAILSNELKEKNKQIDDLNRIIENMQILLKQSQQNQLLLSENLKQNQLLLDKKKESLWKKLFTKDN